jgi:hypothetical protein
LAALGLAASGLGWGVHLLDDLGTAQIGQLLGLQAPGGAEPEEADCLLAICPRDQAPASRGLPAPAIATYAGLTWQGQPNQLSPSHRPWPIIDQVAAATQKPASEDTYPAPPSKPWADPPFPRRIIRRRRSAVAMDPTGRLGREPFYQILQKLQPTNPGLPWPPHVHLALFVHRVEDLAPGLYLLVRDPGQQAALRAALRDDFLWQRPAACPADLALYRLLAGDARSVAGQLACRQAIAADGCFSLGMIAEFEGPLQHYGPWFYRRLYWECGFLGQLLYLAAETASLRGTGIGCFFDDAVHDLLGLVQLGTNTPPISRPNAQLPKRLAGSIQKLPTNLRRQALGANQYQSLYHFTVGQPIEDTRLRTLPAYPAPGPANPTL